MEYNKIEVIQEYFQKKYENENPLEFNILFDVLL